MEIYKIDPEKLDNFQREDLLLTTKELLRLLYDEYPDKFPYEVYWNGTTALTSAAAFVDDFIIHAETQ